MLVDGRSNHEVAVAVALGQPPQMPLGEGPYRVAAKCVLTHPEDGVVTRVPSEQDIADLQRRFPYLKVKLDVEEGTHLGSMVNQDGYRFVLGEVYLGADDRKELLEKFNDCVSHLPLEISALAPGETELEPQQKGALNDDAQPVSSFSEGDRERIHPDA